MIIEITKKIIHQMTNIPPDYRRLELGYINIFGEYPDDDTEEDLLKYGVLDPNAVIMQKTDITIIYNFPHFADGIENYLFNNYEKFSDYKISQIFNLIADLKSEKLCIHFSDNTLEASGSDYKYDKTDNLFGFTRRELSDQITHTYMVFYYDIQIKYKSLDILHETDDLILSAIIRDKFDTKKYRLIIHKDDTTNLIDF